MDAAPVSAALVTRGTLVLRVTAAGLATARRATLVAAASGRVQRVAVHESDPVAAGHLLVVLDTADQALGVAEAEAIRRQAEVQLRELTVLDDRVLDSTVRRERQAAARIKSGLDAAEVALARARLALARAEVRAPFRGRVADVRVLPGGWVTAGDPLLSVVTLDPVRVDVQVLESDVASLAPGRAARVTFPAFPGESFAGRVETINPVIDAETRAARVTVRVSSPAERILPGMYGRVRIDGRPLSGRVLVPRSAVLERDRRTMLFVYEGGASLGAAKWRYVTLGAANDSVVEILSGAAGEGVRAGELVLVDGHATLTHDAPVRLAERVDSPGFGADSARQRAESSAVVP